MSDNNESFIVIDETPSMLQYSLLNTSDIVDDFSEDFFERPINRNIAKNKSIDVARQHILTNSISIEHDQTTQNTTTLAQSFLLGDIDCDKIKNIIKERNDLRVALQRTNATMRKHHSIVNNWQKSIKTLKENHEKELNESRKINDEVFQQNYDLQVKVDELQHLAELSCRTCMPIQNDVVNLDKEPLEKQIQSLKFELAKKISINVEIEEAQEEMKVKLAAIQQLSQNLTAETADLKKKNENLQRELLRAKLLVNEYREKASVIQAQCDVFQKDFEIERMQREQMANERDILLADIKMLRERNKALVDEATSYYNEHDNETSASLTSIVSNANIEDNKEIHKLMCPLCLVDFEMLNDLESHVQSCLEKS